MSKFMDFYNHVTADPAAIKGLEALAAKLEAENRTDQEALLEELIVFAEEQGFHFEKQEVVAFFSEMQNGGALSIDELDAVAGGKGGCLFYGETTKGGGCFLVGDRADGEDGICYLLGVFWNK